MIRVENIEVWGFEHAIRGMRNSMKSWDRSDSDRAYDTAKKMWYFKPGLADQDLMRKLFRAGTEHRKYLRQIFVAMDITAPLFWWKEYDTYKVGTVANSCSTMHKIMAKDFTADDFSMETLMKWGTASDVNEIIDNCNSLREQYLKYDEYAKDHDMHGLTKKDVWRCLIEILPSSYNQKRTVTMDYENVFSIISQREGHKLTEWNVFVDALKTLPYVKEIGGSNEKN